VPTRPLPHRLPGRTASSPRPRENSCARGYDRHWQKLRAATLAERPLCEDCLACNRLTAATECHHLRKVADRPDLRLDGSNLLSLCRACHNARTRRGE
jgi:5-methylcytosine-specific restriction enzyme A